MNSLLFAAHRARMQCAAVAATGALALLAACGGTDPLPAPAPGPAADAAGVYTGTDGSSNPVTLVVLDSGRYYLLYSTLEASPANAPGFLYGDGTVNGTAFDSTDLRDFAVAGGATGSLSGTFQSKTSFSGTATYADSATRTFTATYQSEFDTPPRVNLMQGQYSGRVKEGATALGLTQTLDLFGNFTQTASNGCTATGTLRPSAPVNALFNVQVRFGDGCANKGQTDTGHAVFSQALKTLVVIGTDAAETTGFSLVATKD